MKKILGLAMGLSLANFIFAFEVFAQASPFFSSKLLDSKTFNRQMKPFIGVVDYLRMNGNNSQEEFQYRIFANPHGITSFVYNDPAYTDGINAEFLTVSDQGWDRLVLYSLKGTTGEDDNQFIEIRGKHGTQALAFNFNNPRYLAGDVSQIFISDSYNNRVHLYDINLEVPEDTTGFRGFDSLANGVPLRIPLGIDKVFYYHHPQGSPDSFGVKNLAVADYGNNRVVIFPSTGGEIVGTGYSGFNQPTVVAYNWNKATGWQKNELFVASQGDGRIVWLQFDLPPSGTAPNVLATVSYDFNQLVYQGLAQPNYYLSSATVDNHGLLWILDSQNSLIYKFWPTGNFGSDSLVFIGSWGGFGTGDGQLNRPNAIAAQHGVWVDRSCGAGCAVVHPLANLHDILVTETWGPETGVRRFAIGIDAFADSSKYKAKSNSGGGNYVDIFYRLTDYANVTEKVYLGANLIAALRNNEERTPGKLDTRWPVGNNGSGNYRLEVVAASQYGGVADTINFTVAVDTSLRSNAPHFVQMPHFVPPCSCFFPTLFLDSAQTLPLWHGGAWVKTTAGDLDGDPLSFFWEVDTGMVGSGPGNAELPSYFSTADSAYFAVPNDFHIPPPGGSAPSEPVPTIALSLRITDTDNNLTATNTGIVLLPCQRGDLDADRTHAPTDIVLLLGGVFVGPPPQPAPPYGDFEEVGDMNCDGGLTPTDVVIILNVVFLNASPPC